MTYNNNKIKDMTTIDGIGFLERENYNSNDEFYNDLFKESQEILDSKFLELRNNLYFVKKFEDAYENNYELINILEDEMSPIMHFTYEVKMDNKFIHVVYKIEFSFELDGCEKFEKNLKNNVEFVEFYIKAIEIN